MTEQEVNVLVNDNDEVYQLSEMIITLWKNLNGTRTVNELAQVLSTQTSQYLNTIEAELNRNWG